MTKKVTMVPEHHDLINPYRSQYEEELSRIRMEGDVTLIKVQTARKKLEELDVELAEANKLIRSRKKMLKQGDKQVEAKRMARGQLATSMLPNVGGNGAGKQPMIQLEQEAKRTPINAAGTARLLQTQERLKAAVAERTSELQKLRIAIDETRRRRLDAMATEKEMVKDIEADEDDMKRAQEQIAQLRKQASDVKNEIAATEVEFDAEKQAFRLEQQQLLTEVEEIVKTDKQGASNQIVPIVSHKNNAFHSNINQRRKHARAAKWKRIAKIVSFETKKRLLDRIVEETNVKNLSDFVKQYNDQESMKAEAFARIEAQTTTNAALNESIALLNEDIARLTDAGENKSVSNEKHPSELQKQLDTDAGHIKRWTKEADIFAEAVQSLRGPINDIYKEFFPAERNAEMFDSTTARESGMMRRIGAIEERIMQLIMAKILNETETSSTGHNSDTLRRLRKYQGRREHRESAKLTLFQLCGVEPPSILESKHNLKVDKSVPEDENDDDSDDPPIVAIVHSDTFRQKFDATLYSSSGTGDSTTQAASTSSNST